MNHILYESRISCSSIDLPELTGEPTLNDNHDQIAPPRFDSLNNEQLEVVSMVMATVTAAERGEQQEGAGIFIDARGGSGKTYLFNKLHAYLTTNKFSISCAAWTGVAATLLTGGKTLHSLFKFPVPLTETGVCSSKL